MTLQLKNTSAPVLIEGSSSRPEPTPPAGPDADPSKPARLGLLILLIGFGGFMLWALLAPLDSGVPAGGVVSIESQRKTVQHLTGGIVEKILVREGDEVKAGQTLVVLNSTQARANLGIVRAQYLAARAVENRLMAEYLNRGAIQFDKDLLAARKEPQVAEILDIQAALFATRRASQRKESAVLKESAAALEPQLQGMRELAREGYVPRNKMLDTERAHAEIRLRILQQEQEYRKQVETQLGEAQKEASAQHDRLLATMEELTRSEIKAPLDGYVVGLSVHTVGGIVAPGGHILDVVPKGEALTVEAQVATHLIDHVKVGIEADLRFSAFNQKTTPVIMGKVVTVSADRLTDPATRMPYYLVRISVPPKEMEKLGKNSHVVPGMPVEVIVKGESRTLMNYLLKPLTDRFASSLKEL
ncbi:HlyD family secretion protein [Denitratisoma oestradiolicum]|uniref:Type I secretion membrane fusion protein, HlyD family n=1 Tax=Denitratisoma oestradiolicum TaxID=311182 RepID=A0A6S6Y3D6_9PROT|nr:HlyD family secretion protein [Denitratisoma oestradiolicum]TWO80673.1 hypothetical protein CBW56_07840 [Denitratisoma oestradiolicum]CAB1371077.1 Type I secretion membrane fusion protein, HlyD family [Denitratisoma oestradiolicum]